MDFAVSSLHQVVIDEEHISPPRLRRSHDVQLIVTVRRGRDR
jgi:hypothetical protein